MEHHFLLVYAGISSILSHYVVFHIACLRCIFSMDCEFRGCAQFIRNLRFDWFLSAKLHSRTKNAPCAWHHSACIFQWILCISLAHLECVWWAAGPCRICKLIVFCSTWETSWVRVWFLDVLTHIVFFGYMGRFGVCDGRWNISICLFFTILLTQSWFVSV